MFAKTRKAIPSLAGAAVLGALALGGIASGGTAAAGPMVDVWKAATCECCEGWIRHMMAAGFAVKVHEVEDVEPVKEKSGVPGPLHSCHTAVVDGYVVEGHVPAGDVKRLLAERPNATGLSVPGMPQDAPGMDMGTGEPFQVVLFGTPDGTMRVYASH
ncbi:DUF411 domain-containing protein [Arenibaculum pallidiluteum]|uniref:DUF411 domain-containing protein n=1 Tax=Arenibaculum pallidiluteum TaxID=2812559 RepID=UPI001A95DC75|nr:DUF411 domain-containing protein [Arenibaculum pallidiluteum]